MIVCHQGTDETDTHESAADDPSADPRESAAPPCGGRRRTRESWRS
jgi:hypothetical protein